MAFVGGTTKRTRLGVLAIVVVLVTASASTAFATHADGQAAGPPQSEAGPHSAAGPPQHEENATGGNGTSSAVERVRPGGEVTVRPDTDVFFEVNVSGASGESFSSEWYVDGEPARASYESQYHANLRDEGREFLVHSFSETGTYEVRVELYDESGAKIGETNWTVRVSDDGNEPPELELADPANESVQLDGESTTMDFTLEVTDPDGNLDRVVWWKTGQTGSAPEVKVGESSVSGDRDTATLTTEVGRNYVYAWVIDEDGAITRLSGGDGWYTYPSEATTAVNAATDVSKTTTERRPQESERP